MGFFPKNIYYLFPRKVFKEVLLVPKMTRTGLNLRQTTITLTRYGLNLEKSNNRPELHYR